MHWGNTGPVPSTVVEFNNNVVYNCAFDAVMYLSEDIGGSDLSFNLIGNYLKAGPDTDAGSYAFSMPSRAYVYEHDNQYPGNYIFDQYDDTTKLAAPVAAPPAVIHSSDRAYELVLARAGAFPRDAMNTRTVNEVRNGTGTLGKLDDALLQLAPPVPADQDEDGMADDWENANGLNPNNPDDGVLDADGDGYTNVEEYLNELADSLLSSLPP
jgi:hypothetical protein